MKESRVLEALRALADNDRQLSAPPEVEARLTEAFRARSARDPAGIERLSRRRRVKAWLAGLCIAAAIAIGIFTLANRSQKPAIRAPRVESALAKPSHPAPPVIKRATARRAHSSAPGTAKLVHVAAPSKPQRVGEIVTDFFPLMDPAPPFERGEILRVQVPARTMLAVGLPVSEDHLADRIQADVLVGEEGLPRAIRFVKFETR